MQFPGPAPLCHASRSKDEDRGVDCEFVTAEGEVAGVATAEAADEVAKAEAAGEVARVATAEAADEVAKAEAADEVAKAEVPQTSIKASVPARGPYVVTYVSIRTYV